MLPKWNPWQELFELDREMRDLARRVLGSGRLTGVSTLTNRGTWTPAVDVFTRDGDLVVRAELPGIDPEKDVEITVSDGVLTVRGERRSEDRQQGDGFYRFESSYGAFERHVPLPHGVNEADIKASYDRGVLEVVVPKAAELGQGKRIPVSVGEERKELTAEGRKK